MSLMKEVASKYFNGYIQSSGHGHRLLLALVGEGLSHRQCCKGINQTTFEVKTRRKRTEEVKSQLPEHS